MADDYPTDEELDRLERWPMRDTAGALDFARSLWHWPEWGVSELLAPEETAIVRAESGDRFLRLATGGWSGNESIISALNANSGVRAIAWRLTARGGLHIYKYPPAKGDPE